MKELNINSISYSQRELASYAKAQIDTEDEAWLKAFFEFIRFWVDDDKDIIPVNTSGSTGSPKRISISKQQMVNSAQMTLDYLGLKQNDTALLCMPVEYIAGKMMVVRSFVGKLHLITIPPSSSPLEKLSSEYQNIDFCAMTPMQVHRTINSKKLKERFLQIKKVIIGGGSISPALRKELETLPNQLYETYGMTETISHIAIRQISPEKEAAFTLLPGISISTDENDCLIINAPALCKDELKTNDVVELINDRQFIWKGRLDNIINSGGVKVNPESMEQQIASLFEKRFIIGYLDDDVSGQKVVLIMEGHELSSKEESELLENVKQRISSPVYPKSVHYLRAFPETGFGKINRKAIMNAIF